jgi:hypothetical protein
VKDKLEECCDDEDMIPNPSEDMIPNPSEDVIPNPSEDVIPNPSEDVEPRLMQRERVATISNTTQINRAVAQREADETLRDRWTKLPWYSPDRVNLFMRRKFIKDKLVRKNMKGRE